MCILGYKKSCRNNYKIKTELEMGTDDLHTKTIYYTKIIFIYIYFFGNVP